MIVLYVFLQDQKDAGQRKHRRHHRHRDKGKPGERHHRHRHHHHHRGFSETDSLESRVRTGLQTLEDEKKAIVDITNELSEDQIMNQLDMKDLDTIQSKFVSYGPNGLFAVD